MNGHELAVALLLEDEDGVTALECAAKNGHDQVASILLGKIDTRNAALSHADALEPEKNRKLY